MTAFLASSNGAPADFDPSVHSLSISRLGHNRANFGFPFGVYV